MQFFFDLLENLLNSLTDAELSRKAVAIRVVFLNLKYFFFAKESLKFLFSMRRQV